MYKQEPDGKSADGCELLPLLVSHSQTLKSLETFFPLRENKQKMKSSLLKGKEQWEYRVALWFFVLELSNQLNPKGSITHVMTWLLVRHRCVRPPARNVMFTIQLGTEAAILSKHSQKLCVRVNGKRVGVSSDLRSNDRSVRTIVTPNMYHR